MKYVMFEAIYSGGMNEMEKLISIAAFFGSSALVKQDLHVVVRAV